MNLDGSISHESKTPKGNPPGSALKKLKEKTRFDYKKIRNKFSRKDTALVGNERGQTVIYYSDGTILANGQYYYTNSPLYSEDLWKAEMVGSPILVFFPINPFGGWSFAFSWLFDLVPALA